MDYKVFSYGERYQTAQKIEFIENRPLLSSFIITQTNEVTPEETIISSSANGLELN